MWINVKFRASKAEHNPMPSYLNISHGHTLEFIVQDLTKMKGKSWEEKLSPNVRTSHRALPTVEAMKWHLSPQRALLTVASLILGVKHQKASITLKIDETKKRRT